MRFALLAPLLLAAISPAAAQDVPAYSMDAAEALLDDPAPDAAAEAECAPDTVRMPDGSCSHKRAFTLPNRRASPAVNAPGLTFPRDKPDNVGIARPIAKPRPARSKEVPLQFRVGSSELSPQSMANLRTLATALNAGAHSGKRIQIIGHTDRSGSEEANRRISQQRADAAAAYLADQGVSRDRIDAIGRGFDAPLKGVSAYSPRQRRVEVVRIK